MAEHKGYYLLKQAVMEAQPDNMEFLVVDHSKEEGYESRQYWGNVPVRFIGRASQGKVVDIYRQIDVLFAPSTWPESFGLVTREAAACGCWVVASDLGGIGECIKSHTDGVIVSPSVSDLHAVINKTNARGYKSLVRHTNITSPLSQIKMITRYYHNE